MIGTWFALCLGMSLLRSGTCCIGTSHIANCTWEETLIIDIFVWRYGVNFSSCGWFCGDDMLFSLIDLIMRALRLSSLWRSFVNKQRRWSFFSPSGSPALTAPWWRRHCLLVPLVTNKPYCSVLYHLNFINVSFSMWIPDHNRMLQYWSAQTCVCKYLWGIIHT